MVQTVKTQNAIILSKNELRACVKAELASLPSRLRGILSKGICRRILGCPQYRDAQTVAAFVSLPTEPDTIDILTHALHLGKKVILPRVEAGNDPMTFWKIADTDKDVKTEPPFGIRQPLPDRCQKVDLNEADLLLVPGLAFDKHCRRLGRGKGYYDRALAKLDPSPKIMGLAFDRQVFHSIPFTKNDMPVKRVVTEKRVYSWSHQDFASKSPESTERLGYKLAKCLPREKVIKLLGPLGSGKTVWVKGILRGKQSEDCATSPTYTLVNTYQTPDGPFYHVDLFRWSEEKATEENREELAEIVSQPATVAVEWADRAWEHLPMEAPEIQAVQAKQNNRVWRVHVFDEEDETWFAEFCKSN